MTMLRGATGAHRLRFAATAAIVGVLLFGMSASAHEVGTTRIAATFPEDGTYRIEIVTDASALLDKLETVAGQPRSGATDTADLQARLRAHAALVPRRIAVMFEGLRVQPALTLSVADSADPGGVPGATLVLTGLRPAGQTTFTWAFGWSFAAYGLAVQTTPASPPVTQWLDGGDTSAPVRLAPVAPPVSSLEIAGRYVALGFREILPRGLDHVLFVVGVFLLSRRMRPMWLQLGVFAAASSLTLTLGGAGLVRVPPSIVQPLVALSIACIAIDNMAMATVTARRLALIGAGGLLHGLGFASALTAAGVPHTGAVAAIAGFNAGVELAQLAVLTAAFLAVGYCYSDRTWYRHRIVMPASMCIACVGVLWTLQRLR